HSDTVAVVGSRLMPRSTKKILADLDAFGPPMEDWGRLDELLQELWASHSPSQGVRTLFGVLERYPDHDGYGVFWPILHGLEAIPGYEAELIRSVQRTPTEFNLMMVGRLLNAGQKEVNDVSLVELLSAVATDKRYDEAVRKQAKKYLAT